jgi:hypothetical protein
MGDTVASERLDFAPGSPAPEPDATVALPSSRRAPDDGRRSWRESIKAHRKTWLAIRGLRETILIAGTYTLYDLTRYLVSGDQDGAISHGDSLLRAEKDVALAPEHALNHLFSAHLALGLPADYIYATLHYLVTPAVLIWMWRRNGPAYSWARSMIIIATVLGLVGFSTYPVAPPRLLSAHFGYIDTMAKFSHYGWWSNAASAPRGLGADTNQYAALPSLHVGWALWSGWMMVKYGKRRITKVLGVVYPVVLSVVVMATANHYFLDVVAGAFVILVAGGLVELLAMIGLVRKPPKEIPVDLTVPEAQAATP